MTRRRPPAMVAGAGLVAIGALHLVWAAGSSWPARTRRDLAQAVTGGDAVSYTHLTLPTSDLV